MPIIQTRPTAFAEVRRASASLGTPLTTTEAYTTFVPGSNYVSITPTTFASSATVLKWAFQPWLTILKNQDALATEPTDCSFLLQDGSTTVTLIMNSFDTLANGDAIYIGAHDPFGGLYADVQNANGTSNNVAVVYYNGGLASLSVTDNTDTGASLAIDGTITWTTPTDWKGATFAQAFGPIAWTPRTPSSFLYTDMLYWVRLSWSAAMDSSTSLNSILALPRSTAYDEKASGQAWEQSIKWGYDEHGVSGIAALTDTGTALLIVDNATYGRFMPVASVAIT